MMCPYCGAEVREGTGRCSACLRSLTPRPPVAGSPAHITLPDQELSARLDVMYTCDVYWSER